jgi:ferrous iron transport protein B
MIGFSILKVALLGNPNSGKSSVFNHLTGLNQKVGNFPGVTVDKKTGTCHVNGTAKATIIDLPGTYSLYPKSLDEQVVFDILSNRQDALYPDVAVVVADLSNFKRNLLLFTQVRDLGMPVILALNMVDLANKAGLHVDVSMLQNDLGVPVVKVNGRTGEGINDLKLAIANVKKRDFAPFLDVKQLSPELIGEIKDKFALQNDYAAFHYAHQYKNIRSLTGQDRQWLEEEVKEHAFKSNELQAQETLDRYDIINLLLKNAVSQKEEEEKETFTDKLDKILIHRVWGFVVFFLILLLIFQAVFAWASYPMDLIDEGIAQVNSWLQSTLPEGPLTSLLTDGLIAGLGGILIFVPQIAILFALIAILEESGYMARVMFIMDKIMRKFGLNGKSVVPLISGVACAVPAVMAARSIDNWKDRLITIFVTPLMSCSARIPVFTVLIALVVPETSLLGFFNLQGLALMGLYLLGFVAALGSAWIMKLFIKTSEKSYFIMELPRYRMPKWNNIGYTIIEKVKAFVFEAGKVIMAIAVILWVLASYGPGDKMENAKEQAFAAYERGEIQDAELEDVIASKKLEASYAGHFGRAIEPVIRPLGFDWKIGIALITSFAAREVFIGTMATIYSIGSDTDDDSTIKNRMRSEINPHTGAAMYTPAVAFSLLIFYLFAMQCMSTLAVVYRETKGWKWPLLQLVYMTGLAYVCSFIVYQLMK